jgi:hypothetical protein
MLIANGPKEIVIDHNTIDHNGTAIVYAAGGTMEAPRQVTGFQFTNNAMRHNDYGMHGEFYAGGKVMLTKFYPAFVFTHNWVQGAQASAYPEDNYFNGTFESGFVDLAASDYRPKAGGVLSGRGANGTDIGADAAALMKAQEAIVSGRPLQPPKAPGNLRIVLQ